MRPFHVLVTGLLRTPDLLERGVTSWNAMRERRLVGRVLMVTWQSEADRDPDTCARLRDLGVELIVRPDPPIRGIGNVWPQMLAMDIGLDHLDPDARVFKTRADLWLDPALLEAIATTPGYLDLELPPGASRVFDQRVWVPWFELTTAFYMSDECLFGLARDLRKLINFDESYSLRYPVSCGITHYRRYLHPFRAITDAFEPFLLRYTDTGLGTPTRWDRLASLLADDAYLRCLASAYAAYASHFRFDSPDGALEFRHWSSGVPQPLFAPLAESFAPAQAGLKLGQLFCNADRWLHALLAGELPRDELGDRFAEQLGHARADGLAWNRPRADLTRERRVA
ncbi:MAG: hypothetical protein H6810_07015 [Phycisphaeraceae bacterium]|nr:MAG: hypothetical protein H6810_07015 [Phycisphaeraceae bacterium]